MENINPRPEALWLLRVKGTVQFTQNILEVSHDLETEDDENNGKGGVKVRGKRLAGSKSQRYVRERLFDSDDSQSEIRGKEIETDLRKRLKICVMIRKFWKGDSKF